MSDKGRRLADWLQDIRDAIVNIRSDMAGLSEEAFLVDGKTLRAVAKSVSDIGEAANRIMAIAPEVLANRLTEDPACRVLLLEAGAEGGSPMIRTPAAFSMLQDSPFDWAYRTVPQTHLDGRRIFSPRGRMRGNRRDFDGWLEMGNPGQTTIGLRCSCSSCPACLARIQRPGRAPSTA